MKLVVWRVYTEVVVRGWCQDIRCCSKDLHSTNSWSAMSMSRYHIVPRCIWDKSNPSIVTNQIDIVHTMDTVLTQKVGPWTSNDATLGGPVNVPYPRNTKIVTVKPKAKTVAKFTGVAQSLDDHEVTLYHQTSTIRSRSSIRLALWIAHMERPSLSIRSTRGCWTCRLRKKKCDEIQPGCERCASVNVECHYGVKPAWIEDPALGKTELERIKKIVAVVASRKRAEHRVKARSGSINKSGSQPSPSTPRFDGSRGFPESSSSSALQSPAPTVDPVTDKSWLLKWNSQEEANLIMHYLDHVFYIQFRFYTPAISQGNRGWFLSLLTKTKPLHHAALR